MKGLEGPKGAISSEPNAIAVVSVMEKGRSFLYIRAGVEEARNREWGQIYKEAQMGRTKG